MYKGLFVLFMVCVGIGSVTAQRSSIGISAGGFLYNGDLNRELRFKDMRPSGGGFYRYQLTDLLSFRAAFSIGQLQASDADGTDVLSGQRQRSFRTSVTDIYGLVEYRFWQEYDILDRAMPVMYIFGGLGGVLLPKIQDPETDFSTFQPIIPFGLGLSYSVSRVVVLGAEVSFRKTFFDYLDNVSGIGSEKDYNFGDKYSTDWYHFVGFSVSYVLYTVRCPVPIRSNDDEY